MNFELSDEQAMLATELRALLSAQSPTSRLRELIENDANHDARLWGEFTALGFAGAGIPEAHGGLGLGWLEVGIIAEEIGRANAALPFFSSIIMAAEAIRLAGTAACTGDVLPQLAAGTLIGTFWHEALTSKKGQTMPKQRDGLLFGRVSPVPDAGIAEIAVINTEDGLALLELGQPTIARIRLDGFDQLHPYYALDLDGARFIPLPGHFDIDELLDKAAFVSAFEAVGAAEACRDMALSYASNRSIFARPLSSFQAIKHRLADMTVKIELARSSNYFAAWAATNSPEQLPGAAAAAKLLSVRALEHAARENLQVHGGVGYTSEYDCHFYYRRERVLAVTPRNRTYWANRLLAHTPMLNERAV